MSAHLPLPAPEAAQHSAQLTELVRSDISAQGGWITFARYMELALYAPGLGYYTAGAHKFGEAGDFITAPELSPLFGRTVARQVAEVMSQSVPHVMELGAGSGKLAADMLAELERIGSLPESYSILEVSADLRERQQALLHERLPHLAARVHWLDALPETFGGAMVANEVLDALPVHLLHWRGGDTHVPENELERDGLDAEALTLALSRLRERGQVLLERGVVANDTGFGWQDRPITDEELLQAAQRIDVPDGYVSEICLAQRGLINSLAQRLQQGALLFVDYGFGAREFYHPQRSSGTLMCHYRHYAHDDPFFLPGLQDITAHVNFTDAAECGIDAGLELLGYTTQAFFLLNCGIADFMAERAPENLRDYQPLSAQLQKLTSPAEMGELFKVIALGKEMANPLSGFARGDLSRLL
ncbi:MAG: SAM-dependent methyltransferase [Gallionella sp.]|jgi:SAM-dependent MidA family methyltransferase|nr:SAM-dependent methyltransferase [Gallionella sp.]MCK9352743.1 SAM-dependent methyltransferase [Gallionella sp.]